MFPTLGKRAKSEQQLKFRNGPIPLPGQNFKFFSNDQIFEKWVSLLE